MGGQAPKADPNPRLHADGQQDCGAGVDEPAYACPAAEFRRAHVPYV